MPKYKSAIAKLVSLSLVVPGVFAAEPLVQDAQFNILKMQHGEAWAAVDKEVDAQLADFKASNNGKPPNFLYILIDDIGFGDVGIPELNAIRGYETPNINQFADEGMRMARMYTEPSCTPTRVAMMTGRHPVRNGMGDTAVDISGFGLAKDEVTLAEIMSEAGYATTHIGKWHMGDIEESWPHNQGFDFAAFPIHQQGQLTIFNYDAANEEISIGLGENNYDSRYTMDRSFRPDPGAMVTALEAARGEQPAEVYMKEGERWTEKKYEEMNYRYQAQALEHLKKLAQQDKPFFLQYWPLYPLAGPRLAYDQYTTPNGGTFVEKMKLLDQWIGDILTELNDLGLADNTIVVIMGDNGHFTKYSPGSGFTPMIYSGGKADTTEGGVRVDAFVRWPKMVKADSIVGDIVHVSDLFTTMARIAGATDYIPRDRIIDGVDQTSLWLKGDTFGRRDYVYIYSGNSLKAVVREQYKLKVPGPGENPVVAKFYDLFRDTREEWPVSTEVGAWGGAEFVRVIQRHKQRKEKYPDKPPAYGTPYEGISNLRPETKQAVQDFLDKMKAIDM